MIGSVSSVLQLPSIDDEEEHGKLESCDEVISKIKLPDLAPEKQSRISLMCKDHVDVFSRGDFDVGAATVTEHHIKLTDETPIYQRPRRFPRPVADEIERQVQTLNSLDVVEPSISPWSSPVVPVRKEDGKIRMCIDYRKLKSVTVPDRFSIPNLHDSVFSLPGNKYFTRLDLVKSYYQIPIDEKSRPYTAFSTPQGHYQFRKLSFGLRNAPSAFQREIQSILSLFPSCKVIIYIDDILILGDTFENH